ncbi:DUF1771-domain-containing protein [Cylindrobasidium torrendii FP15055 ss-10]|uniref:DUF1771-domain-containing protein n=1 Tax=Cylindrobasidium torrendii FP15055 ss-10 TaxID=1314674 RepID=A0A0D7BUY5_9AGAR|nr:DUF1771-domain-containing protein [Cylindrobasidium torrendii FP15055 ss-10]
MSFLGKLFGGLLNCVFGSSGTPQSQEGQQHQHQQPHKQEYRPPQQQQQQHRPPSGKPPQQHQQQQHHTPPPKREDDNQVNQQDEHYRRLRDEANQEGDAMARCFEESKQAYTSGNGARAKELSNEGKAHQRRMQELNKKASDWIYTANNQDSGPTEIDLHGLYVKEAIERTDNAIEQAKRRGDSEVRLIVGKGLHSNGGQAKIRPAIEDLMQKHSLVADLDPHNAGVIVVRIQGGRGGMGSDEITRRLGRDDESCTIM